MEKINWINGQAGGTPLSAENLNQMQDNIENAIEDSVEVIGVNINLGSFSANQDKYDQSHTITTTEIPATYEPIGMVGYSPSGTYYSHIVFSKLFVANRTIQWSAKNTRSGETGEITCMVYVLCKNIG